MSSVIFFSVLLSSSKIWPQKMISPFSGVVLYNFNFSLVDVMADCTEVIVCFDLMLAASAFSLFKKPVIYWIVSLGGMTSVTMDVPFL